MEHTGGRIELLIILAKDGRPLMIHPFGTTKITQNEIDIIKSVADSPTVPMELENCGTFVTLRSKNFILSAICLDRPESEKVSAIYKALDFLRLCFDHMFDFTDETFSEPEISLVVYLLNIVMPLGVQIVYSLADLMPVLPESLSKRLYEDKFVDLTIDECIVVESGSSETSITSFVSLQHVSNIVNEASVTLLLTDTGSSVFTYEGATYSEDTRLMLFQLSVPGGYIAHITRQLPCFLSDFSLESGTEPNTIILSFKVSQSDYLHDSTLEVPLAQFSTSPVPSVSDPSVYIHLTNQQTRIRRVIPLTSPHFCVPSKIVAYLHRNPKVIEDLVHTVSISVKARLSITGHSNPKVS